MVLGDTVTPVRTRESPYTKILASIKKSCETVACPFLRESWKYHCSELHDVQQLMETLSHGTPGVEGNSMTPAEGSAASE